MTSTTNTYTFSQAETKKIGKIQFGILSPEQIKNMSVVEIEHSEHTEKGKAKPGGVLDPRMGSIEPSVSCATCSANMLECSGHFAHINLAKPMFHISFLNTTVKILQSVCLSCGALLTDKTSHLFEESQRLPPKARLRAVHNLCRGEGECKVEESEQNKDEEQIQDEVQTTKTSGFGGCGAFKPSIKREKLKIFAEHKKIIDAYENALLNLFV